MQINKNQNLSPLFFQQNLHSKHSQNKKVSARKTTISKISFTIVNLKQQYTKNYLLLVNEED